MLYFDRIEVSEGIDKIASKQVDQKTVIFVTIGISLILVLSSNQVSVIDVIIY